MAGVKGKKKNHPESMNWVQCDRCQDWVLFENSRIQGKFEDVKDKSFKCRICVLEENLKDAEKEIEELKAKVTKLEKNGDIVEIKDKIKGFEDLKGDFKELASVKREFGNMELKIKHFEEKLEKGEDKEVLRKGTEDTECRIDQILTEKLKEEEEKKKRCNNVILFGLKETENMDNDNNKLIDKENILKILSQMKIKDEEIEFKRLGKKKTEHRRPLLITFKDERTKWHVISKGKMLREEREYDGIYISPDLTHNERKIELELKTALKKLREDSEKNGDGRKWTIRKGKIMELRK